MAMLFLITALYILGISAILAGDSEERSRWAQPIIPNGTICQSYGDTRCKISLGSAIEVLLADNNSQGPSVLPYRPIELSDGQSFYVFVQVIALPTSLYSIVLEN